MTSLLKLLDQQLPAIRSLPASMNQTVRGHCFISCAYNVTCIRLTRLRFSSCLKDQTLFRVHASRR